MVMYLLPIKIMLFSTACAEHIVCVRQNMLPGGVQKTDADKAEYSLLLHP